MNVRLSLPSSPRCFLFGLVVAAWAAGPARADKPDRSLNLDEQLSAEAPRLVQVLQDSGVKNVGILRFRVQEGDRPETFAAGPLNGGLPRRLENALVLHLGSSEKPPFGVLHDASRTAAAGGVGNWFRDPAERRKLFNVADYTLAWGGRKARPDAFLTGKVVLEEGLRKGKVVIELLQSDRPESKVVMRIPFVTDAPLLYDLGASYDLSRRDKVTFREVIDEPVVQNHLKMPRGDRNDDLPADVSVRVGDVEFRLLRNGEPVPIRGAKKTGADGFLPCPDKDDKVSVALTNRGPRKVGVDVKFNGFSLVLENPDSPKYTRLVLLEPGGTATLPGFIVGGNGKDGWKFAPFRIVMGEEARKREESLDDPGSIQVTVFQRREDAPPAERLVISRGLRGVRPSTEDDARASLAALRAALMAEMALKARVVQERRGDEVISRELIERDPAREKEIGAEVGVEDFPRDLNRAAVRFLKIVPRETDE